MHLKKHEKPTCNPLIRTYINRTENSILFNIKTGYFLKFVIAETRILLGSAEKTT